eukprot:c13522_g1_i1 orf=125-1348(-)
MDPQYDKEAHYQLHSCRKAKIRMSPSRKLFAGSAAKSLSRFHGGCGKVSQKPLIIHTFDPEVIVTEPGEFMWVVQRLTGSQETRRSLRTMMRKRGEMESMWEGQDVEEETDVMQQSNGSPSKEVSTERASTESAAAAAALMTGDCSTNFRSKDEPSSPLSPESGDFCKNFHNPLVLPLSSDTKVRAHPSPAASSSNSANSKENLNYPSSPQFLPFIIKSSTLLTNSNPSPLSLHPHTFTTNYCNDPASPLSPNVSCDSGSTHHMPLPIIHNPNGCMNSRDQPPWSPLSSPTSGLITSSEDCHTDLSTESSTASDPMEPLPPQAGSNVHDQAAADDHDDEDESNFFVFSLDSYYGNNAAQDDLELSHCNVFMDTPYSSMPLHPCTDQAFTLSCLKELGTWFAMMDEVV